MNTQGIKDKRNPGTRKRTQVSFPDSTAMINQREMRVAHRSQRFASSGSEILLGEVRRASSSKAYCDCILCSARDRMA
jgi:hypothetical protein